jgi:hypothetical protein
MDTDPPGSLWRAGCDRRRLWHAACAASDLTPEEVVALRGPADEEAAKRSFEAHAREWFCARAEARGAWTCACGKPEDAGAALWLENRITGRELLVSMDCVKRFGGEELPAEARRHAGQARVRAEAAKARASARARPRAPAYSRAALKAAREAGWLPRALVAAYGDDARATLATHRVMARVLQEGVLFESAAPRTRTYELVGHVDAGELLGVREREGRSTWRGAELCAPADLRNRIAREIEEEED